VYLPGGGFLCTVNFLWRGIDGHRYMGTAGHCALGSRVGERVESRDGRAVGRLAYVIYDAGRRGGEDFALVRLDPKVQASPQVRHWGGPSTSYRAMSDRPQTLLMFGQAIGISAVAPARELQASAVTHPKRIRFVGPASFSDSGAPVITEAGEAAGWVTTLSDGAVPVDTGASGAVELGTSYLIRIGPMVDLAERALRTQLVLQTAPLN